MLIGAIKLKWCGHQLASCGSASVLLHCYQSTRAPLAWLECSPGFVSVWWRRFDCDFRCDCVADFSRWRLYPVEENLNGIISAHNAKPSPSSSPSSWHCHVTLGLQWLPQDNWVIQKTQCRSAAWPCVPGLTPLACRCSAFGNHVSGSSRPIQTIGMRNLLRDPHVEHVSVCTEESATTCSGKNHRLHLLSS